MLDKALFETNVIPSGIHDREVKVTCGIKVQQTLFTVDEPEYVTATERSVKAECWRDIYGDVDQEFGRLWRRIMDRIDALPDLSALQMICLIINEEIAKSRKLFENPFK